MRRVLYRTFRRVHNVGTRLRARFTSVGFVLIAVLIGGAIFGIDIRKSLSYQLFAIAGGLLVVSIFATLRFRPCVAVRRTLPRHVMLGQTFHYQLEVENLGARQRDGFSVRERLADELPSYDAFVNAIEPGHEKRNAFDRYVGYPRWVWLLRQSRGAQFGQTNLPPISPSSTVPAQMAMTPLRRGRLRFEAVEVSRTDPLGIARASRVLPCPAEVLVLPTLIPLQGLAFHGPRDVANSATMGAHSGEEEFFQLREFRQGDSLRRLHWPTLARLGTPFVREMVASGHSTPVIYLETLAEPNTQRAQFEQAISLAASLVKAAGSANGNGLVMGRAGAMGNAFHRYYDITALEALALVEPVSERPNFEMLLPLISNASALLAIFVDWDATSQDVFQRLKRAVPACWALIVRPMETSVDEALGQHVFAVSPGTEAVVLERLVRDGAVVPSNG
ncbi:MAG: DUF58 domain-containing protein [Gammaproteobacteria bacterium]|nr:DUF58 domain-containing protein [Gammaproteobacteria bacterium]